MDIIKAITTSQPTKDYIKSVFPNIEVSIIPVSISNKFAKSENRPLPL